MSRPHPGAPLQHLVALCALAAQVALAQGTSVLTGTVVDAATQQPLADVTVSATSPSMQGSRDVVTDDTGLYRIPQLPSGAYTLTFQGAGYRPFSRAGIVLRLGVTLRMDVQLLPEALQQTFEVVAPTVDVTNSSVATNIGRNFLDHLPLGLPTGRGAAARTVESLIEVAPSAAPDLFGVSVSGTTSPENGYLVDNVSTGDPAFGTNGTPITVEFIDEVSVITGGYLPEYGRATGGVVSAVTKSGSNELHGSVFGNLTPGALVAPGTEIRQVGGTISGHSSLWNLGDFGAELGGPLLKDRLWFFAGLAPSLTRYSIDRQLSAIVLDGSGNPAVDEQGDAVTRPIPGTQARYFADQRSLQYLGKLTWLLNQDHTLSVSLSGTPTQSGGNGRFAIDDRSGAPEASRVAGQYGAIASERDTQSLDASAKLSSSFLDKSVLLDATVGYHRQERSVRASDGTRAGDATGLAAVPEVVWDRTEGGQHAITEFEHLADASACDPGDGSSALCPVMNYATGGPGFLSEALMERYQAKAVGTWMVSALGHHLLKGGADLELDRFDQTKAYTGKVVYLEGEDGSYFIDFRQFGYLTGPDQYVIQQAVRASSASAVAGGFLQDSWNVLDQVLVNAGVRYDAQTMYGGGREALVLGNQLSPRLGVIYDPTRKGLSKVFANYARYYESVPLDMMDRQFPGERQITSYKDASICNPLDPVAAVTTCMSDAARIPWRSVSDASRYWGATGGVPTIVDPALKPQSSDELVLGGEVQLFQSARAGATYTRRNMGAVIEDMSRDDGATYFIGNPGQGFARDFPRATRDYDALTVYLTKDFADRWLAQASYTLASLRGNYEGLFRTDTGQLDPNINSDFDLLSLLPNRTGALPGDHTHQLKLYAAKEFELGGLVLNVGLAYRGSSGGPTNYLGAHELYGPGEAYLLPRGAGPRLPWVHRVDGHLGVSYRVGRDQLLTVSADLFNAFNFQAVTGVDENYTFSAALPLVNGTVADLPNLTAPDGSPLAASARNPNFGKPTSYQPPRQVRFGARITF